MSTTEPPRCADCDRRIEVCAFCEREACDRCLCYRCVVVALGEFVPQPHDHGG
jgi:hypothetical protein